MDDADLRARFNSIMTKGAKTNTYKFALAKFMLEYTDKFTESQLLNMAENNQPATVDYSDTAMEFLRYYWHQECKYRIRQNSDPRVGARNSTGVCLFSKWSAMICKATTVFPRPVGRTTIVFFSFAYMARCF